MRNTGMAVRAFGQWRPCELVGVGRTRLTVRYETCGGAKVKTRTTRPCYVRLTTAGMRYIRDLGLPVEDSLRAVEMIEAGYPDGATFPTPHEHLGFDVWHGCERHQRPGYWTP